jgi:hypothetical protein
MFTDCEDMNRYCGFWARAGYCSRSRYMMMYCKQSCNKCGGKIHLPYHFQNKDFFLHIPKIYLFQLSNFILFIACCIKNSKCLILNQFPAVKGPKICEDMGNHCAFLNSRGLCSNRFARRYMENNCAATCQFCQGIYIWNLNRMIRFLYAGNKNFPSPI